MRFEKEIYFCKWCLLVLLAISFSLLISMLFSGCSNNYLDKQTYSSDGQLIGRTKLTQSQFLYWSKFKGVTYADSDIILSIGESIVYPDANSVEALGDGVVSGLKKI